MRAVREIIGVHLDLPAEEYHRLPGASASILRKLWQSTPAHLKVQMDEGVEVTTAMFLGTLGHAIALEPTKPLPRLVLYPEKYPDKEGAMKPWSNNSNFAKDWVKTQKAAGLFPVTQKTLDEAHGAAKALSEHELSGPVLRDCRTEVTLITMDVTNDIPVRCRLDIVPKLPFLADCKFTHTVDEREWSRYAYVAGYHIQAALYEDVYNALCGADDRKDWFKFLCVEQKPPHDVAVFTCDPGFIEKGRQEYQRLLPVFAECVRTGRWPGSPAIERTLALPKWSDG